MASIDQQSPLISPTTPTPPGITYTVESSPDLKTCSTDSITLTTRENTHLRLRVE